MQFKCELCSATFKSSSNLLSHLNNVHPYECEICGQLFGTDKGIDDHMRKKHNKAPATTKTSTTTATATTQTKTAVTKPTVTNLMASTSKINSVISSIPVPSTPVPTIATTDAEFPQTLIFVLENIAQLKTAVDFLKSKKEISVHCEITDAIPTSTTESNLSILALGFISGDSHPRQTFVDTPQFFSSGAYVASLNAIRPTSSCVFVIDCFLKEFQNIVHVFGILSEILSSNDIVKIFHGGVELSFLARKRIFVNNVVCTQVMDSYYSSVSKRTPLPTQFSDVKLNLDINSILRKFHLTPNLFIPEEFHIRPLSAYQINYVVFNSISLILIFQLLESEISNHVHFWWRSLISDYVNNLKENPNMEANTYSKAAKIQLNKNYFLELRQSKENPKKHIPCMHETNAHLEMLEIHGKNYEQNSMSKLLKVLPIEFQKPIEEIYMKERKELVEIICDTGRPLCLRFGDKSEKEFSLLIVNINGLVSSLEQNLKNPTKLFSSDNRAGIPETLHRISCIRNKCDDIIGLTYRIGRQVNGTTKLISDILGNVVPENGNSNFCSILLVGSPGKGKTTLLREISYSLSVYQSQVVIIVDSSDEIAGAADIPHPCIGRSRRMSVFDRTRQHQVLIEAVQNHNPTVIIVDEIGTKKEVAAVRTIAQRGVGIIGTAHGTNLSSLLSNPDLVDLVGGLKSVTLGDAEARIRANNFPRDKSGKKQISKTITEIAHSPPFYTMIEIVGRNHFRIFQNLGKRVSEFLATGKTQCEERWIDENNFLRAKHTYYEKPSDVTFEEVFILNKYEPN